MTYQAVLTPQGWVVQDIGMMPDSVETRLQAMEAVEAAFTSIKPTLTNWRKQGIVTDAAGVKAVTIPGGAFTSQPAITITPRMATGPFAWRYTITGTAAVGFVVTVYFERQKTSLNILSLGAVTLSDTPGAVTFDLKAEASEA